MTDIPEWFDLNKYKSAKDFDALDWWWNTKMRLDLLQLIPPSKYPESSSLQIIRKYGAVKYDDRRSYFERYEPDLNIEFGRQRTQQELDIFTQQFILGDSELFIRKFDKETMNISLTLNSSDKELHSAFTKYLAEKRKTFKPKKKAFSEKDFRSFYAYGVLPYLDLDIWRKENNSQLTTQEICIAIYGDNAGVDNFRKTNKKHIDRIKEAGSLLKNQGVLDRSNNK